MPLFQGYISYAPFPEGFEGDMDETFQQSGQLAVIYINGNFLSGIYYPNGTAPPPTLPTSDQGPIALNGVWYFWDPVTGQYLPQSSTVKTTANYAKNAIYQIVQAGPTFGPFAASQVYKTFDMVLTRNTQPNVLSAATGTGPAASADTDNCPTAAQYTVGPNLVATLAASDLFVHEHVIEGTDIAVAQGEVLSLSFSVLASQPGTYSGYLTSTNHDASYVFNFTIATANQWARIKINNIPALPVSTVGTWKFTEGATGLYLGVCMGVGSQYRTSSPNQWIGGFFAGTASNTGNFMSVLNNQLKVAAIKLEAAVSASYCTVKSFEADYEDCIRYYWTSFSYQSTSAGVAVRGLAPNNSVMSIAQIFPVRMCAAPSVIPYSYINQSKGFITDASTNQDISLANLSATQKGIDYLQSNATLVINGNTHGNTTIDGMSTTAGILVGMPVSFSGAQPSTTVATVGTNSITISNPATSALIGTPITFTLGALILIGNTHSTTTVDGLPSTTALGAGMLVSAAPDIHLSGNTYGTTTIDTLSSTTGLVVGMLVTAPGVLYYGNTHGTAVIDNLPSTAGILVGMIVTGQGVVNTPPTTVTAVTSTTVTLNQATNTGHVNIPISFSAGIPLGTTVTAIPSSTSVTLSTATNATLTGTPLIFSMGIAPGTTVGTILTPTSIALSVAANTTLVNVPLTFTFPVKGDQLLAYVVADARLS